MMWVDMAAVSAMADCRPWHSSLFVHALACLLLVWGFCSPVMDIFFLRHLSA